MRYAPISDNPPALQAVVESDLPDEFAEYLATAGMPNPTSTTADAG
jgi:hypothetical protein